MLKIAVDLMKSESGRSAGKSVSDKCLAYCLT